MNLGTGELFGDGEHILYVNGAYEGNDPIGVLMHDFRCSDPNDMIDEKMAAKTRYFKETEEGVEYMCKAIEEMRNDNSVRIYVEACRDFGVVEPTEIVKRLLEKFSFLTEEKAKDYAMTE